ncbi:MAG: histidine kinase, partial [Chloroflexi bacterium]|nr:histidine kinase [Chloroflexota bacterium]
MSHRTGTLFLLAGQAVLTALALRAIRRSVAARVQADTKERAHTATLNILTDTLPYLRTGLNRESARRTVELLLERLDVQAVSIVDTREVLAYVGAGVDHHLPNEPVRTGLTRQVLESGRTALVTRREDIGCPEPSCPLSSAIVAPLKIRGKTIGCLKLYHTGGATLGATELEVTRALAKLFSAQLELGELEVQAARVAQAELEALRAQISPHFLFNTLNTIASFIRTKPDVAHDLVVEFAHFFRETLKKHGEFCSLAEELDYV